MKNIIFSLLTAFLLSTGLLSCQKGELVKADHLFGAITAELASLPGTPVMDVYFNDVLLPDSLAAGLSIGVANKILLEAEQQGTLAFKKRGTDTLLLDTLITIPKEKQLNFRLAYSEDLGIKTFLAGSATGNPDSVQVQIFNNLTTLLPDNITVDGYLTRQHNDGSGVIDDLGVLPSLNRKTISRSITIAGADVSGTSFSYLLRLKDRSTGEFLVEAGRLKRNYFIFSVEAYPGKSLIISLSQKILLGAQTFSPVITVL